MAGGDDARGAAARVLLVVPTLGRRSDYLAETLASVRSQDEAVDLVVVVPPAATDARELARSHGATLLDDPGSLSAAVNVGLAEAGPQHLYGNWIGDDDLLAPGSLRATSEALDTAPSAVVAYGHCAYIDEHGRHLWDSRAGWLARAVLPWGPDLIPQPGMLFRLADFRAVGGLDESLRFAMDLDLLLRLRRRGRFVDVGRTVSSFRWHSTSLTVSDRTSSLSESEQVKRRYLPGWLRPVAPAWELPVRAATRLAARRLIARAATLRAAEPVPRP
jgi:glycosyltransferase involved in cell wall biosynthesis